MEVWLTVADVMDLLGLSKWGVHDWVRAGRLTVKQDHGRGGRNGTRYLVALSSLPPVAQQRWLARYREAVAAAEAAAGDPAVDLAAATLAEACDKYRREDWQRRLAEARRRQEIVEAALAARGRRAREEIAVAHGLGITTLYGWMRRYRQRGLEGLIDARMTKKGPGARTMAYRSIDPEARRYMIALWLDEHRKPTAAWCYERTCREAEKRGWKMCSRATAYRILNEVPRDVAARGREGRRAFENRWLIKCARDTESLAPMEVVMADHHRCDFFVEWGGKCLRPWLTVFFDVFSRCPVGWAFSIQPNAEVLGLAFRHMVLPKDGFVFQGLCSVLYVDNGEDIRSRHFAGRRVPVDFRDDHKALVRALGVEVIYATPYWAWAKAQLERFFGTFADRFSRFQPGWCGRSSDERHPDFERELERLRARGVLLDLPGLLAAFEAWLREDYLSRPHRSLGCTPLQKYLSRPPARPGAVPEAQLDYFLMWAEDRTVARQGIKFMGHWYWHEDLALKGLIGRRVTVRFEPNRLGQIHVYYRGEKICVAENRRLVGIGARRSDVAEWRKEQQRHRRAVEEAVRGYRRTLDEVADTERARGDRAVAGKSTPVRGARVVALLPGAPRREDGARAPRGGELVRRYREQLLKEHFETISRR